MYDLIGDIHGHAAPLKALLAKLGYEQQQGVWRHPERQVIFLGDFIDRGPAQVEAVQIARSMVEAGAARAVMGNHEFNAVAWSIADDEKPGQFLRPHTQSKRKQHEVFLQQFGEGSAAYHDALDWFRTLPLYLDLPGLRVVHACWHEHSLAVLAPFLDEHGAIRAEAWNVLARKGTDGFDALETVLKGMEIPLPGGAWFADKDGHPRYHARLRWWHQLRGEHPLTWHDLAMLPGDQIEKIPHTPAPADLIPGYHSDKPVFVGHYWMRGKPEPLASKVACLDYSIAAEHPDKLVAYRWDGEQEICGENFVWVDGQA